MFSLSTTPGESRELVALVDSKCFEHYVTGKCIGTVGCVPKSYALRLVVKQF
ncbi:protein of unknown function [Mesotoga infera]|uniref:Uncharacterized protein n=1 Tax=Mesotoga infera TaxID=1236046 RepID=A0A7Z7PQE8_9BACT|nr:protein of unknown function [Mesotoga infera]